LSNFSARLRAGRSGLWRELGITAPFLFIADEISNKIVVAPVAREKRTWLCPVARANGICPPPRSFFFRH